MPAEYIFTRLHRQSLCCLLSIFFYFLPAALQAQDKPAVPVPDSIGSAIPDTLLFKLQKAQAAITEINSDNKQGFGLARIRSDFGDVKTNIAGIKSDLDTAKKVVDKKSLQSYDLILKDAQKKLEDWQTALSQYNGDLQSRSKKVIALSTDSLLDIKSTDDATKKLYTQQLTEVKLRLQQAGKITTANLDTVSRLLADVSACYATVTDLQNNVHDRLKQSGKSELGKESPYLWAAPKSSIDQNLGELIRSTYEGQNKILGYFISSTWDNRTLLLLVSAIFFFWVYNNYKKGAAPALKQKTGELKFKFLNPVPVFATLIFMLNLTPLFEPNSPSLYVELNQLLVLVVLTFHFWKTQDKEEFRHWLTGVGLYVAVILTNAVVDDTIWMRLWLIVLNGGSMLLGVRFYKKMKAANFARRFIKPVVISYLLFNLLAVLLNIFGRITLAKTFSITAIVGLTQIIGLAVFVQVLSDALELQIKISSCSGGLFSRINVSKTRATFKRMLSFGALLLWVLVLMINLGISSAVFSLIGQILHKTRTFGSISFTLSNILFFAVILYLSNQLQKHIGLLFGESSLTFQDKSEHKSSKVALIRLVIIIIGVLVAITASGVPMDKLTVMIGALGVGIGLGLQNIINNFVSGIILIFEKPFRIGDYVELADKKGKVQDIGIRSSKMLTAQGSEVIIPNGDLLSGRLVNWTLSNDFVKTEITFKVNMDADLELITKIITDQSAKSDETVKNLSPEILVNAIAADSMELKALIWINNIYVEAGFKSHLYRELILQFKTAGIKII